MGREIRRVPVGWSHPKDERGRYIPLYGRSVGTEIAKWDEDSAMWKKGFRPTFGDPIRYRYDHKPLKGGWPQPTIGPDNPALWVVNPNTYQDFAGERPQSGEYMPDWPEEERTHYQMYEETSEGTPISPIFETPEEVARWCADNGISAFASMTASYEEWLRVANGGYAPSAVIIGGDLKSGVEGYGEAGESE